LVISDNCCIFIVLNYKVIQTIIAMFTESKVTEIFFMADEFCKVFNRMMAKYTIIDDSKPSKRKYHRDSTMSYLLAAIAAYCFFPKKPSINIVRTT